MNADNVQNSEPSQVWAMLQEHKLVTGELPTPDQMNSPWYIRALSGAAGWLASLFLLGFIGLGLSDLFVKTELITLSLIGMTLIGIAYGIFRQVRDNEFMLQLALSFSLCGQALIAIAWLDGAYGDTFPWLMLSVLQVALALIVPNFLHRVLSSWFSALALFWALKSGGFAELGSIPILLTFAVLWLKEEQWDKHRRLFEALGYGLALALIHINGHLLFLDEFARWRGELNTTLISVVTSVGLFLVFVFCLKELYRSLDIRFQGESLLWTITGSLAFIALTLVIPAAACAVLIIVIGFACQRKALLAMGVLTLLCFLSWYYYSLEQSLLFKSLVLITCGVAALLCLFILEIRRKKTHTKISRENTVLSTHLDLRKVCAFATAIIILASANYSIYQKENQIANGRSVYLKLAPVDPRSLMQGDYMRLRFDMETKISALIDTKTAKDEKVIVDIKDKGVGELSELYTGQTLANNQILMQYRVRNGRIKFATNAWFFQEGTAEHFAKAEYGEFKVDAAGSLLLVAMRDKNLEKL